MGGGALQERFQVLLTLPHDLELVRPFPSNLTYTPEFEGEPVLTGWTPVVPGVVRFGPPELLGPPLAPAALPGLDFWGLWFALAGVLVGYLAWMVRAEAREAEA